MSQSFQHIKIGDVKLIQVAHFDTITVKKIYSFAESKVQISDYLPTYNTPRMPNRVWFLNLGKWLLNNYLVNTLLPVEFKKWVASKLEERKQLIVLKGRFTVDVLPEFKAALLSSNSVSGSIYFSLSLLVSKGRSNFLLRSPKKKRGKYEEIKEVELIDNDEYIKEVQYLAELSVSLIKNKRIQSPSNWRC